VTGQAAATVLAFDYGLKRIGVAVGNVLTATAEPLQVLRAHNGQPEWTELDRCIAAWQPGLLIVGVPYNMDGSAGGLTGRAESFAAALGSRSGLRVETVDERLSSREAEETLRQKRRDGSLARRIRREDIDMESACVLLRQWLEAHAG
jgi:putative Holliday junction resolvase